LLASDPTHFHFCQHQKRTAITARHDLVVRTLAKLFRQVGAVVHIEPRIYGSERLRPDMDITFPDRTLMLDVAITHPASPSRTSSTPLAAAAYTEKAKSTKYAKLAATQAATFLPFVVESYGAFGKRAKEVLKILRNAAKNSLLALSCESVDSFAAHAARTLSERATPLLRGGVRLRPELRPSGGEAAILSSQLLDSPAIISRAA
jgi:hypothetical protein